MNQTSSRRRIAGYALATLGTVALVAVLLPFRDDITPLSNGFVFLALVVVTGAVGGLVPGIVSSFTSFLAFNYFFIPPYDTFAIGRGDHVVVLFVFLGLSGADLRTDGAGDVARRGGRGSGARAAHAPGSEPCVGRARTRSRQLRRGRRDRWCRDSGSATVRSSSSREVTRRGSDELLVVNGEPGSVPLAAEGPGVERLALNVGGRNLGVLVLRGASGELSVPDLRILRAFADQLALVLERDRMLRVAMEASKRAV